MADDAAIHLPKDLAAALAAEAERAGLSVDTLAGETIARHLEALETPEHFARLKANADWDLLDRVLTRPSAEDDRVAAARR